MGTKTPRLLGGALQTVHRILSLALAAQLVLGGMPLTALAAGVGAGTLAPTVADNSPGLRVPGLDANFETSFKDVINGDQIKAAQDVFVSCQQNPMLNAIQSVTQGVSDLVQGKSGGAQINIGSGCPKDAGEPFAKGDSCEAITDSGGNVDKGKVEALRAIIEANQSSYSCQDRLSSATKGEIGCLMSQARALGQQIQSLQKNYTDYYGQATTYMTKVDSIKNDRVQQIAEVKRRLEGGEGGVKGLLQLKQESEAMLTNMGAEIDGVEEAQRQVVEQRKSIEEFKEEKKMALAMKCFKETPVSAKHLDPDTRQPLSPYAYLIKTYSRQAHLGKTSDGRAMRIRNETSQANARKEMEVSGVITSALETMVNAAPKVTEIPSDPEALKALLGQHRGLRKPADAKKKFDTTFNAISEQYAFKNSEGKGFPLKEFVYSSIQECYNRAVSDMNSEMYRTVDKGGKLEKEALANSRINQEFQRVDKLEKDTNTRAASMVDGYTRHFTELRKALTEQHVNMPNLDCKSPKAQVTCMKRYQEGIRSMLNSNASAQGGFPIPLPVRNPEAVRPIVCGGLSDCVAQLQQADKVFKNDIVQIDNHKKEAAAHINQRMQQGTEAMRQQVAKHLPYVTTKIDQINAALARLGMPPMSLPQADGKPEDPGQDQHGVTKPPTDIVGLLAGGLAGLLKGSDTGSAMERIGEELARKSQEINQKLSQAKSDNATLNNLISSCAGNAVKELWKSIAEARGSLNQARCNELDRCESENQVSSIMGIITGLKGQAMLSPMMGGLENGIKASCPEKVSPSRAAVAAVTGEMKDIVAKAKEAQLLKEALEKPVNRAECVNALGEIEGKLGALKTAADKAEGAGKLIK